MCKCARFPEKLAKAMMATREEHYLTESNFEIRGAAESKQFLCKE
jgi:hypothetical protein